MAQVSRRMNATPAAVFKALSNGWGYSSWVVGTSHVRAVEPDWPAVGSRLFHRSGVWPLVVADETRVEEMIPERQIVMTARGGLIGEARVAITLEEADGGTVVTLDEVPVHGLGHWLYNPITVFLLRRRNEETLGRLAALAECRDSP